MWRVVAVFLVSLANMRRNTNDFIFLLQTADPNFARSLLGDLGSDCPQTKRAFPFVLISPISTHLHKKKHLNRPTNHLLHTRVQQSTKTRRNHNLDFFCRLAPPDFARSFLGDPASDRDQTKRADAFVPTDTHLRKKKQLKCPTNHLHTTDRQTDTMERRSFLSVFSLLLQRPTNNPPSLCSEKN